MEIGTLVTLLGLTAGATDQDITGRAQALVTADGKLRELTGKGDPAAALALIEGWRDGAAKLAEANKELAKIRDREESSAHAALVAQGEKGIATMGPAVERAFLLARLAEIDATADGSVRATLDRVTIELGAATTALVADVADGREDEHHKHAAALERIAGIALRGAGAARRRAEEP